MAEHLVVFSEHMEPEAAHIKPVVHEGVGLHLEGGLTAVWEVLQLGLELATDAPQFFHVLSKTGQLFFYVTDLQGNQRKKQLIGFHLFLVKDLKKKMN